MDLKNLTSLLYLLKGTTLIYAGQELCATRQPSLFDKDPIAWDGFGSAQDLTLLMQTMARIKHEVLGTDDFVRYVADDANDIAVIDRLGTGGRSVGVFSLKSQTAPVKLDLPDGSYLNLVDDSNVQVTEGRLLCTGQPVVLHVDTGVEAMV